MAATTRLGAAVLLAAVCTASNAEILHGVGALDTLGDLKRKYPNATIEAVKAAWVTSDQGFYRLSGKGFPGELYVAFSDDRPLYRSMYEDERKAAATAKPPREPATAVLEDLMLRSDEEALSVNWVRWVPSSAIPLERYKSKYGEPAKCDFTEDTMQPYCSWPARGLLVALSDDRKMVLNVEANFTKAERRAAYQAKYGQVPTWMKEALEDNPRPERKATTRQPK